MIGFIESEPHVVLVATLIVVIVFVVTNGLIGVVKFADREMEGPGNVLAIQVLEHFEMGFVAVFERRPLELLVGNVVLILILISIIEGLAAFFEREAKEFSSKFYCLFSVGVEVFLGNDRIVLGPVFKDKESFIKEACVVCLQESGDHRPSWIKKEIVHGPQEMDFIHDLILVTF